MYRVSCTIAGMAQNLHKRLRSSLGESLTVWNRSKQKASTLVEDGAHLANSPEDLASCSIVFAMLADDGAVKQVPTLPCSDGPLPCGRVRA